MNGIHSITTTDGRTGWRISTFGHEAHLLVKTANGQFLWKCVGGIVRPDHLADVLREYRPATDADPRCQYCRQ